MYHPVVELENAQCSSSSSSNSGVVDLLNVRRGFRGAGPGLGMASAVFSDSVGWSGKTPRSGSYEVGSLSMSVEDDFDGDAGDSPRRMSSSRIAGPFSRGAGSRSDWRAGELVFVFVSTWSFFVFVFVSPLVLMWQYQKFPCFAKVSCCIQVHRPD